jgi:hypothetical protein
MLNDQSLRDLFTEIDDAEIYVAQVAQDIYEATKSRYDLLTARGNRALDIINGEIARRERAVLAWG